MSLHKERKILGLLGLSVRLSIGTAAGEKL